MACCYPAPRRTDSRCRMLRLCPRRRGKRTFCSTNAFLTPLKNLTTSRKRDFLARRKPVTSPREAWRGLIGAIYPENLARGGSLPIEMSPEEPRMAGRSEEHTSELQSLRHLV